MKRWYLFCRGLLDDLPFVSVIIQFLDQLMIQWKEQLHCGKGMIYLPPLKNLRLHKNKKFIKCQSVLKMKNQPTDICKILN